MLPCYRRYQPHMDAAPSQVTKAGTLLLCLGTRGSIIRVNARLSGSYSLRPPVFNNRCMSSALPSAASRAVLSKIHQVGTSSDIASILFTRYSSHGVS